MIKTIEEDQIEAFLFNPFERVAYFKDKILQKYPYKTDVDHVLRIDDWMKTNSACFVLYGEDKILYEEMYDGEPYFPEDEPFIRIRHQRESIRSNMCDKIIEMVEAKRSVFRLDPVLNNQYEKIKRFYFDKLVAVLLGAEHFDFIQNSQTYSEIRQYISRLSITDIIDITKDPKIYQPFLESLAASEDLITYDIFYTEVLKEAREYVNAGVFSDKEKLLIDFIDKTKDCGAKKFTVIKESGESFSCLNKVTHDCEVPLSKNNMETINIEDIAKVRYSGKIIYKKPI